MGRRCGVGTQETAAAATSCSADNDGAYNAPMTAPFRPASRLRLDQRSGGEPDIPTANAGDDWTGTATHVNSLRVNYTFTTDQADANTGKVMPGAGC